MGNFAVEISMSYLQKLAVVFRYFHNFLKSLKQGITRSIMLS